jgi:hypothetical protein
MANVKPIPEGSHTITPGLVVRGARKAIEYYKSVFGAKELSVMTGPDGRTVMHAELQIGDRICVGVSRRSGRNFSTDAGRLAGVTQHLPRTATPRSSAQSPQGHGEDAAHRHVLGRPLREDHRSFGHN